MVDRQTPLDPAIDRALLVLRKVVAGMRAQQDEYFLQRLGRPLWRVRDDVGTPPERV